MVFEELGLSPEHLELTRELWEALDNAPSPEALEEARARFTLAPEEVRSAILRANIAMWQQGDRRQKSRRQGDRRQGERRHQDQHEDPI